MKSPRQSDIHLDQGLLTELEHGQSHLEDDCCAFMEKLVPDTDGQLDVKDRGEEGEEPVEGDQADLDAVEAEHLVKGGKMARYLPEKYKNKVSAIHPKFKQDHRRWRYHSRLLDFNGPYFQLKFPLDHRRLGDH